MSSAVLALLLFVAATAASLWLDSLGLGPGVWAGTTVVCYLTAMVIVAYRERARLGPAIRAFRQAYSQDSGDLQRAPVLGWLERAAADDLQTSGRVIVWKRSADWSHVYQQEPYVDFILTVFNGSLWEIAFERADGHIRCGSRDIQGPPQLVPGHNTIASGSSDEIRLRQWLNPNTIAALQGEVVPRLPLVLDFSSVDVRVLKNPRALHGQPRGESFRLDLSTEPFDSTGLWPIP
jgi:hypothetical protein